MSLDSIMNLQITVESRAPSQAGFGTPLLFGYHTRWLDRLVKEYSNADEMLDDGFTTDDPLYKAAQIVKSQNPSPDIFKIGRRTTALTQVVKLTVKKTSTGFKYVGIINGVALSYTVLAAATTSTIATALASLITTLLAGAGTAAAVGAVVTITAATPGSVIAYDFVGFPESAMDLEDATVDTTTDDELPLIADEDDDWYGLGIVDSSSTATALNAAGWIETKKKIFIAQCPDSECLDTLVTDDTMSELKDSSYARSAAIYHRAIGGKEWVAIGWLAGQLTKTPGSATTAFKTVAGTKADKLLQGQENAIASKNGSHYTTINSLNLTFEGKSGAGEFLDTTRFLDWVYARQREAVLGALASNDKIPYTDEGVDTMRGLLFSVIQRGQDAKGFARTPEPTVTAPKVATIPVADRINRVLPDLEWTATLAGAIHALRPVRGRVSV